MCTSLLKQLQYIFTFWGKYQKSFSELVVISEKKLRRCIMDPSTLPRQLIDICVAGATAANRTVIIMEFSCLFRVQSVCSVLLILISASLNRERCLW